MYNLVIRKCTSPPLPAPRLKIFKWKFTTPQGLNPAPAEPEADILPSEPVRRAWRITNIEEKIILKKISPEVDMLSSKPLRRSWRITNTEEKII